MRAPACDFGAVQTTTEIHINLVGVAKYIGFNFEYVNISPFRYFSVPCLDEAGSGLQAHSYTEKILKEIYFTSRNLYFENLATPPILHINLQIMII